MARLRSARGQATSEYVALVALVAVVLAAAAGLTSGGLGSHVLAGLQRGLCQLAGAPCPRPLAPRADLAPCPIARHARGEELSETIAVVRLGTSATLSATRMSDGRVTVTLAEGGTAGGRVGAGAQLRLGRRRLGGGSEAAADAVWSSGRSWTFASAAAARRFVAAYGAKATIGGKLVDRLRSRCSLLCDAIGWRPHPQLPEPDETFEEGGALASLAASFGRAATFDAAAGAALGRRIARDGATTWYVRLDGHVSAGLALGHGALAAAGDGEAVLSYALDRHGSPQSLGVRLAGGGAATVGASAPGIAAGGERGAVVELEATLDLHDPANRAAAAALLNAPWDVGRARALAARIVHAGQLDRRVYAAQASASGVGGQLALGIAFGGAFARTTSGLTLLSAETRLPGLPFLPRDDCRPA